MAELLSVLFFSHVFIVWINLMIQLIERTLNSTLYFRQTSLIHFLDIGNIDRIAIPHNHGSPFEQV